MKQSELEQYLKNESDRFPGKVAYQFVDMDGRRETIACGEKDRTVSASMIKVPVMLALFDEMKKNNISHKTELPVTQSEILPDSIVSEYGETKSSLYELAYWMIVNSDNTAANVLMNYLGFDRINRFCEKTGLNETRAERCMLDEEAVRAGRNNYMSLADFYTCICLLRDNEKKDPFAACGLEILKKNRDYGDLLRYITDFSYVAHKSGELDDIIHDAGLFGTAKGSYFFGVFVSEFAPEEQMRREAEKLIGRMSEKVYQAYNEEN